MEHALLPWFAATAVVAQTTSHSHSPLQNGDCALLLLLIVTTAAVAFANLQNALRDRSRSRAMPSSFMSQPLHFCCRSRASNCTSWYLFIQSIPLMIWLIKPKWLERLRDLMTIFCAMAYNVFRIWVNKVAWVFLECCGKILGDFNTDSEFRLDQCAMFAWSS